VVARVKALERACVTLREGAHQGVVVRVAVVGHRQA
jgi:hypothetical protein